MADGDMEKVDAAGANGAAEEDQDAGVAQTPAAPAQAPAPAQLPAPTPAQAPATGPAQLTNVTATIPTHIRGPSSPSGMPDRIPPRVDTPVTVGVSGWIIPMVDVVFSIVGQGGGNGAATINGAATAPLNNGGTLNFRGTVQTDPGHAGNLTLVAKQGTTTLAQSNGFSVSSIPENFFVTFNSQINEPDMRGLRVNNHWVSDSGNVADLDQAERSEQVEYTSQSGIWAGVIGGNNSSYLPANNPPLVDSHGTPLSRFTGPGSRIAQQTFTFNDHRTGATDIPAKNSGFRLTRTAVVNGASRIEFTVDKTGTATTANGFASGAGSGSVARTQVI